MKLSPKQLKFVQEYLLDLNATQAAIRAGYSAKTAQEQSSRLLSNVIVSDAIAALKIERAERTKVNADWLLTRLAMEAEADVMDLYDDNGNLKPIKDWPKIWRQGLVAGIETVQEKTGIDMEGNPVFATVYKIKLSDRVKRLELIGKHIDVQAFAERQIHEGMIALPMSLTDVKLAG